MQQGKLLIHILFIVILSVFLSSCAPYEYDGKNVDSLEYITVDYFGGYTNETTVDLINGQVLTRSHWPEEGEPEDPSVEYTFDVNDVAGFLNEIGAAGLFELDEEYTTTDIIMDGGGWTLTIHYTDGTSKTSTGSNARPDGVFESADYGFYHLYGEDLFGTLPSSYKNPPALDFMIQYTIGNSTFGDGSGLTPINYTWNGATRQGIDVIQYATDNPYYVFDSDLEYQAIIWTANLRYKFSRMTIVSFDLNGSDKQEVESTRWFDQKEYDLEPNRIYVIDLIYEYGTCQYAFSTEISEESE